MVTSGLHPPPNARKLFVIGIVANRIIRQTLPDGNIIVNAVPIGGLRMIDDGEADDKIIAVMDKDEVYSTWRDISDVPKTVLDRLKHYFLTYKQLPGEAPKCEITHVYGREEAHEVIRRSKLDYEHKYGDLESALSLTLFEAFNFSQRQKGMLDAL